MRSRRTSNLRSASSWVSAMITVPSRVLVISAGSRPSRSQWASRTPIRWRMRSGSPKKFEASAYWATIRSVFFSPLPPIMIGMSPRIGFGLLYASWTLWCLPS